jgi:glycosyltransferase involved in cell wall biosynthesis
MNREEIETLVRQFNPQAIFMSGWLDKAYLQVARDLKREGVMIVAGSDTQWTGSLRQQVGQVIAPWYLHSAIDVLWVSGERQRQLAQRLGYTGSRCWSGVYACDWHRFAEVYAQRNSTHGEEQLPCFLYVGRYVSVKGLDVLVEAYRHYRALVPGPWPLICAGAGEQQHLFDEQEGIENRGFIQPDQLPALMAEAAAFVLPSRREPWGVVVQEAAATGLPLLCSDASGAAVHLLQDHYNGYLFENGNAIHLAHCMVRLTEASIEERQQMGHRSYLLSQQYTPQRWASTFMQGVETYL